MNTSRSVPSVKWSDSKLYTNFDFCEENFNKHLKNMLS